DYPRIVFVLFSFFFGVGLGLGRGEGDSLAVGGPVEPADSILAFGQMLGFASVATHHINLRRVFPIGDERKSLPIRRPSRGVFRLRRARKSTHFARANVQHPDVSAPGCALWRLAYDETHAFTVGRYANI